MHRDQLMPLFQGLAPWENILDINVIHLGKNNLGLNYFGRLSRIVDC